MQETRYGEICQKYQNNACPHGISGKGCSHYHPKMCKRYIKYGPRGKWGCKKTNCKYFHPKLCYNSLKPISQRFCLNEKCKFFHLPKTKRHRRPVLPTKSSPPTGNISERGRINQNDGQYHLNSPPANENHFLMQLIRQAVKESVQSQYPPLSPHPTQPPSPPFAPGMNHFNQSQPTQYNPVSSPGMEIYQQMQMTQGSGGMN